jgi:hypothetical protein
LTASVATAHGQLESFGRFEGRVVTEWLDDGREMRLVEDFAYVDPSGVRWDAPAGSVVDGASIPRPFWSVVGSPFTGRYRTASVLHDVAADRRDRGWRATHRMFYTAARLAGTDSVRAKQMYGTLHHCGPRWGADPGRRLRCTLEDLMRLRQYVERRPATTPELIDDLTSEALRRAHPTIRPEMRWPPADPAR